MYVSVCVFMFVLTVVPNLTLNSSISEPGRFRHARQPSSSAVASWRSMQLREFELGLKPTLGVSRSLQRGILPRLHESPEARAAGSLSGMAVPGTADTPTPSRSCSTPPQ